MAESLLGTISLALYLRSAAAFRRQILQQPAPPTRQCGTCRARTSIRQGLVATFYTFDTYVSLRQGPSAFFAGSRPPATAQLTWFGSFAKTKTGAQNSTANSSPSPLRVDAPVSNRISTTIDHQISGQTNPNAPNGLRHLSARPGPYTPPPPQTQPARWLLVKSSALPLASFWNQARPAAFASACAPQHNSNPRQPRPSIEGGPTRRALADAN